MTEDERLKSIADNISQALREQEIRQRALPYNVLVWGPGEGFLLEKD